MTDPHNNQNDQPSEKQITSDQTQAEYREISKEELKQILEDHQKWVESNGEEGKQADLSDTNLKNAKLYNANLEKASLWRVNLQKSNLMGTNFRKAYLTTGNLQRADLSEANLQKANCQETNLKNAIIYESNLQKANFREANLQKARIEGTNLQKADLTEANLQKANINLSDLQKANLVYANLRKANFVEANLQKAEISEANLHKANLHKANLPKASFFKAVLQNADLSETNLKDADLTKANLQDADLSEANLQDAHFSKSDLQRAILEGVKSLSTANLKYANLEGAIGLLGNEFAQADLTGTKLPKNIEEFKALETVEKTSQNARKIFFAMLLGCVYSWLTIATTTDVRLLTNTASSPLPIIGTEIPIAGFYWAAPLVLICLYVYFHLYLDNLWKGLAGLPAIFPNGKPLDQTAYPWLLNSLVCRHFEKLKKRTIFAHMKEWITIFLAWAVVPFTMTAFWFRYIPRHDWFGTCLHICLIVLSVGFALIFYRLCALTLQGKEKVIFIIQKFWTNRRFYYDCASLVIVGILFLVLSYGAIEGDRHPYPWEQRVINYFSIKDLVPRIFKKIGYDVFADFEEKSVSEKPNNYGQIDKEERLEFVSGAKLKGTDLRNADMYKSFLVKADLRGVNAYNVFLKHANLQQASLVKANLQKTSLQYANLQKAELNNANLQGANLQNANLQNAILMKANLKETTLWNANLKEALFIDANLQNAMLQNANLQKASFYNANLQGANFFKANLKEAKFEKANLTGAKNLLSEQLSQVKTLYKAVLDPELLQQVRKCCPQLLEKPK